MESREFEAHKHSLHNRTELLASSKIGCFHCMRIFSHTALTEFCDGGETGLCPACGSDSLIGDRSGFEITKTFLKGMNQVYF